MRIKSPTFFRMEKLRRFYAKARSGIGHSGWPGSGMGTARVLRDLVLPPISYSRSRKTHARIAPSLFLPEAKRKEPLHGNSELSGLVTLMMNVLKSWTVSSTPHQYGNQWLRLYGIWRREDDWSLTPFGRKMLTKSISREWIMLPTSGWRKRLKASPMLPDEMWKNSCRWRLIYL